MISMSDLLVPHFVHILERQDCADAIELDWGQAPAISGINTVIMSAACFKRSRVSWVKTSTRFFKGTVRAQSAQSPARSQDCVYLREVCPLLLQTLNALAPEKVIWAQEMRGIEEDRTAKLTGMHRLIPASSGV